MSACVAYLLAPGHPFSVLDGVPLGEGSLALLGLLLIGLFGFGLFGFGLFGFGLPSASRPTGLLAGLLIAATALKIVLWWSAPTYGFAASYYARARIGGTPERSTEAPGAAFTRVETMPGAPLNLHFFNDVERFNFYEGNGPERRELPFAVRWDGYLHLRADGPYPFQLAASGDAALSLDGRPVLTVADRDKGGADGVTIPLSAGAHPIRVDFVHPGGSDPLLALSVDLGHGMAPLGPASLTVHPADQAWLRRDAAFAALARALDVGVILAVCGLVLALVIRRARELSHAGRSASERLERPLLAALLLGVLVHALGTTASLYRQTVILEGGQDWLTYESYARDIVLNGPLMTLGKPLGQGKPYFFQPFYPYYLALLHGLTGEDLWGPVVIQLLGLGVAGVVLYFLAKWLFGVPAAVATLGLFLVLRATQLDWVARKLLSENLYFFVLPAAILLLLRYADERRARDLVGAGLLFGVASITRAPTLLYLPLAAWLTALALRRHGTPWRSALLSMAVLGVLAAFVAALVPLRNYLVAGRPALVATNGGATLLLAHTPTPKVRLSGVDRDPLYNRLNLDRQTREVVEFVRQDPIGYAATLVPLGLYSVGVSGAIEGTHEVAPDILAIVALYVLALALLPAARALRTMPLHAFVGLHLAIMMTFLPYVYGYRQVLPMHLLMLPFGGFLLGKLGQRLPLSWVPRRAADVPLLHERAHETVTVPRPPSRTRA